MHNFINSNDSLILSENRSTDQIPDLDQGKKVEYIKEIQKVEKISSEPPKTPSPPLSSPDIHESPLIATPVTPNQVWLITSKPSDEVSNCALKPITEFLGAVTDILWPIAFIVIIFWLRNKIYDGIQSIIERLKDKNTDVTIGPIELKVKNLQSEIKSLKEDAQVIASVSTATTSLLKNLSNTISEELRKLSSEYKSVNIADWGERVRKKDELAGKMASIIIKDGISRDLLAHDSDEGIKVALATATIVSPQLGDDDLIAVAAPGVQRLNVRYRFMMAIAKLIQCSLIKPDLVIDFKNLCKNYREGADISLNDRIDRTETQIDAILTKQ